MHYIYMLFWAVQRITLQVNLNYFFFHRVEENSIWYINVIHVKQLKTKYSFVFEFVYIVSMFFWTKNVSGPKNT